MEFLALPIIFLVLVVVLACGSKKAQKNEDDHKAADKQKRGW